ncbi:MAG: hypothetical protein CM15mV18_0820 [uncultured marine virus]|nr:MAG: hypothetical protein CM15mV18_0820 [uncultured marine virus]
MSKIVCQWRENKIDIWSIRWSSISMLFLKRTLIEQMSKTF